jgi:oxygen-dependent protoporphyrinogen oxidase
VATAPKIIVIGGGISGLACAWRLQQRGLPVLLLERGRRFGGVIDTAERDGFLFDIGPQSFTNTKASSALVEELGLAGELLRAPPRAPRYILKGGRLVPAPLGPAQLLFTPLLGARTKLRILSEPFRRTRPPDTDESVAAFARRKFGPDLLENLVAPFVSGVWAGDPEKLSLASAFPGVHRLEEGYGSIIRGALKQRRESAGARAPLCNFRGGLSALVAALAAKLGHSVLAGAEITAIRPAAAGSPAFEVAFNLGGAAHSVEARAVIIAARADQTARLVSGLDRGFPALLARIEYAGVAQVSAGYRLDQIKFRNTGRQNAGSALRGFGFLVPRSEGLRLLGTVWNSALFPGRAPGEMASFTSFLGGMTDPEIVSYSPDRIAAIAHSELSSVLGISGAPVAQHVSRWERALPQYHIGHERTVAALRELCAKTPGVFLVGNYLAGPSLGACVEHANEVADRAARFFSASAR